MMCDMPNEEPTPPTPSPGWSQRPVDVLEMADFEIGELVSLLERLRPSVADLSPKMTRALFDVWVAIDGARFNLIATAVAGGREVTSPSPSP